MRCVVYVDVAVAFVGRYYVKSNANFPKKYKHFVYKFYTNGAKK